MLWEADLESEAKPGVEQRKPDDSHETQGIINSPHIFLSGTFIKNRRRLYGYGATGKVTLIILNGSENRDIDQLLRTTEKTAQVVARHYSSCAPFRWMNRRIIRLREFSIGNVRRACGLKEESSGGCGVRRDRQGVRFWYHEDDLQWRGHPGHPRRQTSVWPTAQGP